MMIFKKYLNTALLAFTILFSTVATTSHANEQVYLVEILPLHEGVSVEQARAYFEKIYPIVARFNAYPVDMYEILQPEEHQKEGFKMGDVKSSEVLHIWKVDTEKLPAIFKDADYLTNVKMRDSIFNLAERKGWMVTNPQ